MCARNPIPPQARLARAIRAAGFHRNRARPRFYRGLTARARSSKKPFDCSGTALRICGHKPTTGTLLLVFPPIQYARIRMNTMWYSSIFGYGLVFVSAYAGLFHWRTRVQRSRPPVAFKLLRGPGELTHRGIRHLDTTMPLTLLFCVLGPLIGGLGLFAAVWHLEGHAQLIAAVVAGLAFLTGLYFSGRHLLRRLNLRQEMELRLLGERAVAEELQPLLSGGYRMFHDVTILGVGERLDLDHVTVGPNGVTVIETEARQRETNEKGPREHEVTFDGKQLVWPWGPDRTTVAQVEAQAVCLSKWLAQSSGIRVFALPILALPGWWIDITGRGSVSVVNHKQVLNTVLSRTDPQLTAEQIEQISRLLEEHCRDVAT
jgi:hypothetical protein